AQMKRRHEPLRTKRYFRIKNFKHGLGSKASEIPTIVLWIATHSIMRLGCADFTVVLSRMQKVIKLAISKDATPAEDELLQKALRCARDTRRLQIGVGTR